ncbi:hypothetical protein FNX48_005355 [Streptomyces sp. IF17]|nr:hypothetical protein [Streptomyces alkaliphilus]
MDDVLFVEPLAGDRGLGTAAVPGGDAVLMGRLADGVPVGAKAYGDLRERQVLFRVEAGQFVLGDVLDGTGAGAGQGALSSADAPGWGGMLLKHTADGGRSGVEVSGGFAG